MAKYNPENPRNTSIVIRAYAVHLISNAYTKILLYSNKYKIFENIMKKEHATIEIKTPDWSVSYNLLDKKHLDYLGIDGKCIRNTDMMGAIPTHLYTEKGVASIGHPLVGSMCLFIDTCDGKKYSIDDIWYYDYNIRKMHYDGKEHWNHETRYVDVTYGKVIEWTKGETLYHTNPATDWIEATFFENDKKEVKRTYKQDFISNP